MSRHPMSMSLRRLPLLGLVAAALVAAPSAWAEQYREPAVGYRGVLTLSLDGKAEPPLRVRRANRKIRLERAEGPREIVIIFDLSTETQYLLLVKTKTYRRVTNFAPIDPAALVPLNDGTHTYTRAGAETVNGVATTKYKVSRPSPGAVEFDGFVWRTKNHIVVRTSGTLTERGKSVRVLLTLTDLKTGPLDPKLFQVPAGYQKAK